MRLHGLRLPFFVTFVAFSAAIAGAQRLVPRVEAPPDQVYNLDIGPVTLSTVNPLSITPIENSSNLSIDARNRSSSPVTLQFDWSRAVAARPSWMFHFFKLFGFSSAGQLVSVSLAGGETRTLKFYLSKDVGAEARQEVTVPFGFRVIETGDQGTLSVTVYGDDRRGLVFRPASGPIAGVISGRVTSSTGPVANALVSAGVLNENNRALARTDASGNYRLEVLSVDEVRTVLGPKPQSYRSLDYYLTVEADGYAMAYRDGITPRTGTPATVNVTLDAQKQQASYTQVGEISTSDLHGYWRMAFFGAGDRIVAVQGEHDNLPSPGHIIGVDVTGRELWRVPTGDQCWGLDVSRDGRRIAAGCYDHYAYIVSDDGRLLQKLPLGDRPGGNWVMEVRFSPDGSRLLVDGQGGPGGITVVDVDSGRSIWTSRKASGDDEAQWAYKAVWSSDGSRVLAASSGQVSMYTSDGNLLWRATMGESPLWLTIDDRYNVFAAGKTRELFAWDRDGNLRWSYRIAHTTNEAGTGMTTDGSFMVLPTFNGLLQAFANDGRAVWQRFLPIVGTSGAPGAPGALAGPGHNAMSMTPDGGLLAVGTRGYQTLVYDRNGTQLWSHTASARAGFSRPSATYPGVAALEISPDGRYLAVGYSDSVIRVFKAGAGSSAALKAP